MIAISPTEDTAGNDSYIVIEYGEKEEPEREIEPEFSYEIPENTALVLLVAYRPRQLESTYG